MAVVTIDIAGSPEGIQGTPSRSAYYVEKELDFAAALTEKGTALVATDIIQLIDVPANTMILSAGAEVITAANATAATVDIGTAGGDIFVDGMNAKGSAGTYGAADAGFYPVVVGASGDTIDVTVASLTGTLSTGKLRVFAVLIDVDGFDSSRAAAEVDRDVLA